MLQWGAEGLYHAPTLKPSWIGLMRYVIREFVQRLATLHHHLTGKQTRFHIFIYRAPDAAVMSRLNQVYDRGRNEC